MSIISTLLEFKIVILFYVGIVSLLYLNRKKFDKEGPFIFLYRTKLGLNLMDKVSSKYGKIVRAWGYVGIVIAYIGFFLITFLIIQNAIDLIIDKPGTTGGSPVIPGLPIAGLGITFPLITGWISLFILIIVHEFAHGVVARAHNVKVKSSGLAFFGPLLGAFVEPDDKQLLKKSHKIRNSV